MLPQVAAPQKLFKEIAVILNFHLKNLLGLLNMAHYANISKLETYKVN